MFINAGYGSNGRALVQMMSQSDYPKRCPKYKEE